MKEKKKLLRGAAITFGFTACAVTVVLSNEAWLLKGIPNAEIWLVVALVCAAVGAAGVLAEG